MDDDCHLVPRQALAVLRRVQAVIPQAIIAGGCLRDGLLGRPINDIDLFVPDDQFSIAEHVVRETHPEIITKTIYRFTWNNVARVRYYKGAGLPVNLIAVYDCTPEFLLERFDFGLCKIAFDGKRLWKDIKFDIDAKNETLTLYESESAEQRASSMERYARLMRKYVGWRFIDATPKPTTSKPDMSKLPTVVLTNSQIAEFSKLAKENLCNDCYERMMNNLMSAKVPA